MKKRKVHFKTSADGGHIVHRFEQSCNPEEIWWTLAEMSKFRRDSAMVVDQLKKNGEYMWALDIMIQASRIKSRETTSSRREALSGIENTNPSEDQEEKHKDIHEAFCILTTYSAITRGLELYVRSETGLSQKHTTGILARIAKKGSSALLAKESRLASQPSVHFARTMASIDVLEAAQIYLTDHPHHHPAMIL
eukprot:CAMPEP_0172476686 /NCGR_PEP_ID=MMETSP1065-20121228/70503_1 /TAXON_ID=265537 /ORGANISM="Amphiprora paludosa, Strain CCMP125" /LENGTH=193 /DNA_ID=CAMNT_0013234915 /DNA_START=1178 /DNA_END=1759 /DNA_ORIENTATION=-